MLPVGDDRRAGIGATIDGEKDAVPGLIDTRGGEIEEELALLRGDLERGTGRAWDGEGRTVHGEGTE